MSGMTEDGRCFCGCGKKLTGRKRKWATADCGLAAQQERANAKYHAKLKCHRCDTELVGRQMKWCSMACKAERAREEYDALMAAGSKQCVRCEQSVLLIDFYSHPTTTDRLRPECKACTKGSNRSRLDKPDAAARKKDYQLRSYYNISLDQYEQILADQKGVCAICCRPPRGKMLAVDHDHSTGIVRGLLCPGCNLRVVGKHRSGEVLRRAADYLDSPPAVRVIGEVVAPNRKPKPRKRRAPRRGK